MKFKENVIKPGMVICFTAGEEENTLLNYLKEQKYRITQTLEAYGEGKTLWCGVLQDHSVCITSNREIIKNVVKNGYVVEFFDLIEPDDSPVTANEVLESLRRIDDNGESEMIDVFGCTLESLFDFLSNEEIMEAIKEYEAAKKEPKPVEVEWNYYYGIVDSQTGKVVQDCGVIYETEFQKKLQDYIKIHGMGYYGRVEKQCRVKGE